MKFRVIRLFALVLAPLALVLTSCVDDPTDEGNADPFAIVSNTSVLFRGAGEELDAAVFAIDRNGTRIPDSLAVTVDNAAVVVIDSVRYFPELAETRIFGKTTPTASAAASIVVSLGALSDTIQVVALSPGTRQGAAALIFRSPVDLFDADTEAHVGDAEGTILSRSARELAIQLPFGASGPVEYELTGLGPGAVTASGTFNAVGVPTNEPGEPNDNLATADSVILGASHFGSLSSNDVDDVYKLVITEAGTYDFSVDWTDAADVDIILLNSTGGVITFAGATSAHPEHFTRALTPGTYYIDTNLYTGDSAFTNYTLIVRKL
jgi:hypothetical protein